MPRSSDAPIRTGWLAGSKVVVTAVRLVSALGSIVVSIYGWRQAGFWGAVTGLTVAAFAFSMCRFLMGVHQKPLAGLKTWTGICQRLYAILALIAVVTGAHLGGWRRGWLLGAAAAIIIYVLFIVTLFLLKASRAGLGAGPELESKLESLFRNRVQSGHSKPSPEEEAVIDELLDHCEGEVLTAFELAEHEATRPLLKDLYLELLANGGGIRVENHFVAAAALATFTTLSFLLANRGLNGKVKVELLIGFFEGRPLATGGVQPHAENDFLADQVGSEPFDRVKGRLHDISMRLAESSPEGVLLEPAIEIKLDHRDEARAEEDVLRALQDRSVYPRVGKGDLKGKSKPLVHSVALGQLLDLAFDEPGTARVLRRHNVDRGQLSALFEELFEHGANAWQNGSYIAAAALLNPETLDFLVRCKSAGPEERARQALRFFQGFPIVEPEHTAAAQKAEKKKSEVARLVENVRGMKLLASGEANKVVDLLEGQIDVDSVETSDDLLYCLGMAYLKLNRRAEAEKTLLKAVDSARLMMHMAGRYSLLRSGGVNQHSLARDLVGLGMGRLTLADYGGALEAFSEARNGLRLLHLTLRVNQKVRTSVNQLLAYLFDGLGETHEGKGEPLKAQVMYGCSLRRRQAFFGMLHPETGKSLYKLGVVALELGDYGRAQAMLDQSEAIFRQAGLTSSPDFVRILCAEAQLCTDTGQFTKTDQYVRPLLATNLSFYLQDTPRVIDALTAYATAYVAVNAPGESFNCMNAAIDILDKQTNQVLREASERQRNTYLSTCRDQLNIYTSLVAGYSADNPDTVQKLFEFVQRYKEISTEAALVPWPSSHAEQDEEVAGVLRELAAVRCESAALELRRSRTGKSVDSLRLVQLVRKREILEKRLARVSQLQRAADDAQRFTVDAIAAALPENYTLVEYLQYDEYDFKAVPSKGEPRWRAPRWLAFTLAGGDPSSLRVHRLGLVRTTEELIAAFRSGLTGNIEDTGTEVNPDPGAWFKEYPSTGGMGEQLRTTLLDPLPITEGSSIIIAPDGNLARLPFAALPDSNGRPLFLTKDIAYIGVGRDLLRKHADTGPANPPAIAADPDFWLDSSLSMGGPRPKDGWRLFQPLPGTRKEAATISLLLGVKPILGSDVTEGLFSYCASPLVLHVATHGFFLPASRRGPRSKGGTDQTLSSIVSGLESPMLRSGLALAGANAWLRGDRLAYDIRDGLLTAEEVAGIDLSQTQLTVLSACETALGDIAVGQGVLGLRRAFVLAGSRSLVTALWKVPDEMTCDLMERFYANLLEGMPRSASLQKAQLAIFKDHPEPRNWAAFIVQGDLGPIEVFAKRRALRDKVVDAEREMTLGNDQPEFVESVTNLVNDLFESGDIESAVRLETRICSLLRTARPAGDAEAMESLGKLSFLLRQAGDLKGSRQAAENQFTSALHWRGEDHQVTNDARRSLSLVLTSLGDLDRARELAEKALESIRRQKGDRDIDTLIAYIDLAETLREQGHVETSYEMQKSAIAAMRETLEDNDDTLLTALSNLSISAMEMGNLEEAREIQMQCLRARTAKQGENSEKTICSMATLAAILGAIGAREEAYSLEERVFAWRRLVLGESHPDTLLSQHNLARSYLRLGDRLRARELVKQVAVGARRVFGESHSLTLAADRTLADCLDARENFCEVLALRESVLERARRLYGEDHRRTLQDAEEVASLLVLSGEVARGIELLEATRSALLRQDPPDLPLILSSMGRLAAGYSAAGDKERSVEISREAAAMSAEKLGDNHETTLHLRDSLAAALHNADHQQEAFAVAEQVLNERQHSSPENDSRILRTRIIQASILDSLGQQERAGQTLIELAPLTFRLLGERHPDTLTVMNALGKNLLERKQAAKAMEVLEQSYGLAARLHGPEDYRTLREQVHLALACLTTGNGARALKLLQGVTEIRDRTLGPDHKDTLEVRHLVEELAALPRAAES